MRGTGMVVVSASDVASALGGSVGGDRVRAGASVTGRCAVAGAIEPISGGVPTVAGRDVAKMADICSYQRPNKSCFRQTLA